MSWFGTRDKGQGIRDKGTLRLVLKGEGKRVKDEG